jgi:hypothetical protein
MRRTRVRAGSGRPALTLAALVSVVSAVFLASPAGAATTSVDCAHTALQPAIDAADPGDTLVVVGSCSGNFVVDKDLVLEGTGTLDGADVGTTLTVRAGTVEVAGLTITNGRSLDQDLGGGITNDATLILRGTASVSGNTDTGIMNWGTLTLRGSALVSGNSRGGIGNFGLMTMNGVSSVRGNTSSDFGAGIFSNSGTTIMNDWSSVRDNTGAFGGGLWLIDSRLAMIDSATVAGNRSAFVGGGIFLHKSVATLTGSSSVTRNIASVNGGGIVVSDGLLTLSGSSSVSANKGRSGGGIRNEGAGDIHLNDHSSVGENRARLFAGGIWNGGCTDEVGPTVTMSDSSVVRGNVVGTRTQPGYGGGISSYVAPPDEALCSGITNLIAGRIVRNHAAGGGSGGGVFGPIAILGSEMTIRLNTPDNCDPPC